MGELVIRFVAGGVVVSAFALLGDILRPKSFAGLFGAAPSIAMVSMALAIGMHGPDYVATEARSMIAGAVALGVFSVVLVHLIMHFRWPTGKATVAGMATWFLVSFVLLGICR